MARPIAGENQFPFTIGGFIVDGAKINGVTYNKELFIHKQRSSDMYDLVDANGNVFQFVRLVYRNAAGNIMNFYQISSILSSQLADNTFFMKVQDPNRNIYGFATLWQWWKVKVHTGDYIFRTNDIDPRLSGVSMSPTFMSVRAGQTGVTRVSFIPYDYPNKTGKWYISNANISSDIVNELLPAGYGIEDFMAILPGESRAYGEDKDFTPLPNEESIHAPGAPTPDGLGFQFTGATEGYSIIRFVPDANDSLTAMCIVQVLPSDEPSPFDSVSLICDSNYQNNILQPIVRVGQEFTLRLLFEPFDYVPPRPWTPSYGGGFEYLGSDDNINYKFRTTALFASSGVISLLYIGSNGIQSLNISISKTTKSPSVTMTTKRTGMNIGETYPIEVQSTDYDTVPLNDSVITFQTSNPSIATTDGYTVTAHAAGPVTIRAICDGVVTDSYECVVGTNFPEKVHITPENRRCWLVGETQEVGLDIIPSTATVPSGSFALTQPDAYFIKMSGNTVSFVHGLTPPLDGYMSFSEVAYKPVTPIYQTAASNTRFLRSMYSVKNYTQQDLLWAILDVSHTLKVGMEVNMYANDYFINAVKDLPVFLIEIDDETVLSTRPWTVETVDSTTARQYFTLVAHKTGKTNFNITYLPTGEKRTYIFRVYE